ncbi:nitroreductase family protein [Roseibium sediminis]|uniref:nitroreductase family protein n=1 Tax=Roseibium sediminis TaxID=1775174 RepID=UPI00123CAA19|nr:nitroreductase family protein [Roseibium sediminis]
MTHQPDQSSLRRTDHAVDSVFVSRWSPRSFVPQDMPEEDLLTIFEAARWAPSAYNVQPWRFVYARRSDAHFQKFIDLLMPFNRTWAHTASALVFIVSDTIMPGSGDRPDQPSAYHTLDTGSAWGSAALQATMLGYHTHGMAVTETEMIREVLNVPDRFKIEMAFAVGKLGDPNALADGLRDREKPSPRRPLSETAWNGSFKG